jgi:hypothetical protein
MRGRIVTPATRLPANKAIGKADSKLDITVRGGHFFGWQPKIMDGLCRSLLWSTPFSSYAKNRHIWFVENKMTLPSQNYPGVVASELHGYLIDIKGETVVLCLVQKG